MKIDPKISMEMTDHIAHLTNHFQSKVRLVWVNGIVDGYEILEGEHEGKIVNRDRFSRFLKPYDTSGEFNLDMERLGVLSQEYILKRCIQK